MRKLVRYQLPRLTAELGQGLQSADWNLRCLLPSALPLQIEPSPFGCSAHFALLCCLLEALSSAVETRSPAMKH